MSRLLTRGGLLYFGGLGEPLVVLLRIFREREAIRVYGWTRDTGRVDGAGHLEPEAKERVARPR